MQSTKVLRNRIKSVTGTGKIVKAMELVASSRIRKAQARIFEARPYMQKLQDFIFELSNYPAAIENPLIKKHDQFNSILIIGLTADRGLCGGYNSSVIKLITSEVKKYEDMGKKVKLIIIGTKGKNYFRYIGRDFEKVYENLSDYPKFLDAREIADDFISLYLQNDVDKVKIVYTIFKNTAEQSALSQQILPVPVFGLKEDTESEKEESRQAPKVFDIIFEPSSAVVLNSLVYEYVYTKMYSVLLEATASETGARMTAMRSATDSAGDMIRDLTRKYHRARQQQITIEISEIASGAEALNAP